MRPIALNVFKRKTDINPQAETHDWSTLITVLTTHKASETKDSEAVGFYELKPQTSRATHNVISIHCVALDFDQCVDYEALRSSIGGYECVFHTTYSHASDCPNGRLVMPLSRPATPEEWPDVWRGAYLLTNELADKQTSDASRIFYLPRCPESKLKDAHTFHNKGVWIDTDDLIDLGKSSTPTTPAPKSPVLAPAQNLMDDFDVAKIRDALSRLDWDNREVWRNAGMALHSSGKGDEAYSLWEEFSKRSEKFKDSDQRKTWRSFISTRDKLITLGTLFHMGRDNQPPVQVGEPTRPERSELGLAERFVTRHKNEVKYITDERSFVVWNGNVWERDTNEHAVMQRMIETVKAIPANEVSALMGKNNAEAEKTAQWAIREAQRRATMVQALQLAAVNPALSVRTGALDANPELFQCANGIVNLRTREFSDSHPDAMHTLSSPINFDANATCPRWLQFLHEVTGGNHNLIAYLRRSVGYTLSGKTDAQVWFFVYGLGANGKSVFLNVLRDLAGTYGTTASADSFMTQQRNSSGATPEIAALAFRRLVCVTEIPQGRQLDEARMKTLTGGEKMSARQLYKGQFTFEPRFKLWFAGNHKPAIRGNDHGMWRRIQLIPFTQQIPADKKDSNLLVKLRTELPGILNWAIEGYSDYAGQGLTPPQIVLDEVQSYRGEEDILGDWIAECCDLAANARAPRDDLFMSYQRYRVSRTIRGVGNKTFYASLRSRGLGERRANGERLIEGMGLRLTQSGLAMQV
jgi:P4 family phage/plasmid primase-like protien